MEMNEDIDEWAAMEAWDAACLNQQQQDERRRQEDEAWEKHAKLLETFRAETAEYARESEETRQRLKSLRTLT